MTTKVAILAYGSMIDDPRAEILAAMIGNSDCTTPFNIQYARQSQTRPNRKMETPAQRTDWVDDSNPSGITNKIKGLSIHSEALMELSAVVRGCKIRSTSDGLVFFGFRSAGGT
jgi:hypothetical protein